MNKFQIVLAVSGGLFRIVLFPLLITLIISLVLYLNMPDVLGLLAAMFVCSIGLLTGIIMAIRVWIKRGPSAFLPSEEEPSETESSPEPPADL